MHLGLLRDNIALSRVQKCYRLYLYFVLKLYLKCKYLLKPSLKNIK